MTFLNIKSNFKTTFILLIGVILFIISCNRENTFENKKDQSDQIKFPLEFAGNKVLEYNKPFTLPNGKVIIKDTFPIYYLINKSIDTIWVVTPSLMDTTRGYLINKTIKHFCISYHARHIVKDNQWLAAAPFIICKDSIKLLPNEKKLFFFSHKGKPEFDSTLINFNIKIKKGHKIKDSILSKKLIYKIDHFIEDTIYWKSIERH